MIDPCAPHRHIAHHVGRHAVRHVRRKVLTAVVAAGCGGVAASGIWIASGGGHGTRLRPPLPGEAPLAVPGAYQQFGWGVPSGLPAGSPNNPSSVPDALPRVSWRQASANPAPQQIGWARTEPPPVAMPEPGGLSLLMVGVVLAVLMRAVRV
jgi:hypothetical protein